MNKLDSIAITALEVFLPFLFLTLIFVMMLFLMPEKKVKQGNKEEKQDKRTKKIITALAYTMIITGGVSAVAIIITGLITINR